jgi:hypothetical protein
MVHYRCAENVHGFENTENKSIRFGVHSSVHIKKRLEFIASQPLQS